MANYPEIFDRQLVRNRRNRAALNFAAHDFMAKEVASRLIERLGEVNRDFKRILILGDAGGVIAGHIATRYRPEILTRMDLSKTMLQTGSGPGIVASEEFIPFAPQSFDLVISNLTLHWVNDLPGCLVQLNRTLKPDGLFLAAFFGGETLSELRQALARAEVEITGGLSPRVSPFADIRGSGSLLQRAGFALPLVDADTLTVTYSDAFALMQELRGMGEGNALNLRPKNFARRAVFLAAAKAYGEIFARGDGRLPATFEVLFMTGWAPDASQPKPLRPGSAKTSLKEALKGRDELA
jgi:SAM-dependent methyltransferase